MNTSSTRSYAMGADTVGARQLLSKVPEVTIYFWIIKVLCTTVGETVSDFLNVNLGFGLTGTSIVMGAVLLEAQLKPMNPTKWTEVDGTIDTVLRQLRAANQDPAACKAALEKSLAALK